MASNLFLVHWKPEYGLPVIQGRFDTADAAIEHMQALAAARTNTGDWAAIGAPAGLGADSRDVLLRSSDGVVESFFITEHRVEDGGAVRTTGTDTAAIPRVTEGARAARAADAVEASDARWQSRYRLNQS